MVDGRTAGSVGRGRVESRAFSSSEQGHPERDVCTDPTPPPATPLPAASPGRLTTPHRLGGWGCVSRQRWPGSPEGPWKSAQGGGTRRPLCKGLSEGRPGPQLPAGRGRGVAHPSPPAWPWLSPESPSLTAWHPPEPPENHRTGQPAQGNSRAGGNRAQPSGGGRETGTPREARSTPPTPRPPGPGAWTGRAALWGSARSVGQERSQR